MVFLPKRSTVWQLLSTIDDWEETLDNGDRVHACFLDMAKAFDKVNHDLLLRKLRSVGVYSLELKWFSSYLHGRSISTVVEGVKSSPSRISSGVPRGSVLGPLLFLVYYRDLPSVTSSSTAMFADDTQLYDRCLNSPNQCNCRISEDLERNSNWANQWDTTFNASKSMHMFFNLRQPKTGTSPILTLGAVEIPFTERTRHLGVVLTSSLKWTDHVQSLIRKQSFHVFVLKRLAQRRNSAAIVKRLFVGLVRPALEYASPVWDGCPKRDCVALERIQLAVARAVYAVHVVTCQTRKRFVALDGQRWHGDAGVRSCQFCGTCCSNVDHLNSVTRCHAQLLSVVITLFVTVLLLPFPSAALSIVKTAFYLLLLPFSILSQLL